MKKKKTKEEALSTLIKTKPLLKKITLKTNKILKANQILKEINLPLLKNVTVLNFEKANLLLGTDKQSVLTRFHIERSEILRTLRHHPKFIDLLSVKMKLFIDENPTKLKEKPKLNISDEISKEATSELQQIKNQTNKEKLKHSIDQFLKKHGKF